MSLFCLGLLNVSDHVFRLVLQHSYIYTRSSFLWTLNLLCAFLDFSFLYPFELFSFPHYYCYLSLHPGFLSSGLGGSKTSGYPFFVTYDYSWRMGKERGKMQFVY